MEVLSDDKVAYLRRRGRESLFFLAYGILGFGDLNLDVHGPICNALEQYEKHTRIKITLPRDWFKSTIASIAYPIWRVINNRNLRILIVHSSFLNATKKLQSIKQIFEKNDLFRLLYPEVLPTSASVWTKECLTVNRTSSDPEGTFEAAGTGTAVTGRHYDVIIEDDTIAPEKDAMTGLLQQPTQLEIEKAIGWHRLTHPLLVHPEESQIIVIGTRWTERDLLSWIDENTDNFYNIERAAREKDGRPCNKEDGGSYVWERFNDKVLSELEKSLGPYMFAALYMNRPTDAINQVFKREWIRYYENIPKEVMLKKVAAVDLASAKREESGDPDYTVVVTTGIDPETGDIYVLDYMRDRYNPEEQVAAIFENYRIHKPLVTKIESISYQRTLVHYVLKRMKAMNMFFEIEEVRSLQGSKVDRIRGLQPYFSSGKIFIRSYHSELERELLAFPKGAHDDVIDAISLMRDFWYNETVMWEKARNEVLKDDIFSGQSIIDEFLGRAKKARQFPYDIGHFAQSQEARRLRMFDRVGV